VIDVGSIVFFVLGVWMRRIYLETGKLHSVYGFPDRNMTAEHVLVGSLQLPMELGDGLSGITGWKFCYGVSLCFLVLRALRILSMFHSLGLLVIVFLRMLKDVSNFFVVFLIFTLSFSVLLLGSGDPRGLIDKCRLEAGDPGAGDYVYAVCMSSWWFLRTLLQAFGELFLEEMNNEVSVVIMFAAFIVLNVVLLNLLIAIMSGTYEMINEQAMRQLMLDRYSLIKEHSRWAIAMPPFLNLIVIPFEILKFAWHYRKMRRKYVARKFWDLFDMYLSRNCKKVYKEVSDGGEDRRDMLRYIFFICMYINLYTCMYIYVYIYIYICIYTAQELRNRTVAKHAWSKIHIHVSQMPNEYNKETVVQYFRHFKFSKSGESYSRLIRMYLVMTVIVDSLPANTRM